MLDCRQKCELLTGMFLVVMGLLSLSRPGVAQVPSIYGSLSVMVHDTTGAVVPGALVEVTLLEHNQTWSISSNGAGRAFFPNLQPGDYKISVSAPRMNPQTSKLTILLGHRISLNFTLAPATLKEEVTVTAPTQNPVDASALAVHTNVTSSEIKSLPINQRNFLDFSLLDSAIQRNTLHVHAVANTSGFNVMGQRPRSNSVQLDGADLNDESTGGVRGSVSMEAVQEIQVLANGYQAEYGRASGGVIDVITKSGSNEFHGSVFGFLRHRSMDATNAFSPVDDPPYTRTQYGASLGGPLRRSRTFFFVAGEQLRRQESGFSRIGDNPATFALTPEQEELKASDPANPAVVAAERGIEIARTGIDPATGGPPDYHITPLGGLSGIYPVSQVRGAYSLRLDHDWNPANRTSLRFNYARDRQSSLEPQNNDQIAGLISPGRTATLTTTDPTLVVSLSSTLDPTMINEARFSWARRKFDMYPNSPGTSVNIPGSAFIGREPILPHLRTETHWHFQDTFMVTRGTHLFKFGGDLMLCPTEVDYQRQIHGLFNFGPAPAPNADPGAPLLTPVQAYGLGLPSQFVQQFGNTAAPSGKVSGGLFAQDSWQVRPRFSLDYGIRYDVEAASGMDLTDPSFQPVFDELKIQRRPPVDKNNLQFRIGFAYHVLSSARVTLRGSYGIYHDRLLNLATYLSTVGDGGQIQSAILAGEQAVNVFHLPEQKLDSYPGSNVPTGLVAFSRGWALGDSQQGNLLVTTALKPNLSMDIGYVWIRGTHLPRSRDYNPPSPGNDFIRPNPAVSEVMTFENSSSSTYHGLRAGLRGQISSQLMVHLSYTFSKAIDDAEEMFPHWRNQNMFDFRSDRGLALYDQRQRLVFSMVWNTGDGRQHGGVMNRLLRNWIIAPIVELGSGRPVNVLLGFDNNRDGYPGSDRPDVAAPGTPGSVTTAYGTFVVPPHGVSGNLGRDAFTGPGFASLSLRLERKIPITERLSVDLLAEGFNLLNRTNVRTVNPNYKHAGEPLTAYDPRQIQLGVRLRF